MTSVTSQTEIIDTTIQNAMSYGYRANGQLNSIEYPTVYGNNNDHDTLSYHYNNYGQLSKIKRNNQEIRSYTYDSSGMVTNTKTYLDFNTSGTDYMQTVYQYNNAGLVTDMEYKLNGTTQKEKYSYTYYNNGMIKNENATAYGNTINKLHEYDDIGRLKKTTIGSNEIEAYKYDEVGNRIEKKITKSGTTDTWDYTFNKLHQLTEIKNLRNMNIHMTHLVDKRNRISTILQRINLHNVKTSLI